MFATQTLCIAVALVASPPEMPLWQDVAAAQYIVAGAISAPPAEIEVAITSTSDERVNITVRVDETLKGDLGEGPISVVYNSRMRDFEFPPGKLKSFEGKRAILFLIRVDESAHQGFYFPYVPNACRGAQPDSIMAIRAEVERQKTIVRDAREKPRNTPSPPRYKEVRKLIGELRSSRREQEALDSLIALGKDAVPAIVQQMQDFRKLPDNMVHVENRSPEAFEAYAHYTPKAVVDALDLALSKITGLSFAYLMSGGSDRERRHAIDAWRVYVHYNYRLGQ